jgi:hypothetical protein
VKSASPARASQAYGEAASHWRRLLPVFDEVAQDEIGNTDKYGNGGNISDYLYNFMPVFRKPAVIYSFILHLSPHSPSHYLFLFYYL